MKLLCRWGSAMGLGLIVRIHEHAIIRITITNRTDEIFRRFLGSELLGPMLIGWGMPAIFQVLV